MAVTTYGNLRDNNCFAVHTLDICFSICGIELNCQARYVRVHPNVMEQDETDKLIEATVRAFNSHVTHVGTINQKAMNEPYHNQLKYSNKIDVPVAINLIKDSTMVKVNTNIEFILELYCEDSDNRNFFAQRLSNNILPDLPKWGEYVTNMNQYVPFSKFFAK